MNKFFVVLLVLCVGVFAGWCMNLYKLTQCDFQSPYKCEVIRAIGIVPPVGAVAGWIDIED